MAITDVFVALLGVCFIVLKMLDIIKWHWLVVLIPAFLLFGGAIFLIAKHG